MNGCWAEAWLEINEILWVTIKFIIALSLMLLTIRLNWTCRKNLQEDDETCSKGQVIKSVRVGWLVQDGEWCSDTEGAGISIEYQISYAQR